ncbi:MAG: hypothetical protein QFX35_05595 [Candidatus Verstraetearchaeota archaeon]|nr:hypothetical protein [Candidatus Verstraetearchaeota archaeon]
MSPKIAFYRISPSVFPVSVTGSRCDLDCPHCRGRYLSGMYKATMPPDLLRAFMSAKRQGARRILITGGFTRSGALPIEGMVCAIEEGKRRTGLAVSMHAGIIGADLMERIAKGCVDTILLDVIGSQETISCYLGGAWNVRDYERALRDARRCFKLLAPHVLIGIDRGRVVGEFKAIDMIAAANPGACALLVMTDSKAPGQEEVREVMRYARKKINAHLTLGCMRGRGKERLAYEVDAVDTGLDGIANPSQEAVEYAKEAGKEVFVVNDCCVHAPNPISAYPLS